jgi:hypothetical protein
VTARTKTGELAALTESHALLAGGVAAAEEEEDISAWIMSHLPNEFGLWVLSCRRGGRTVDYGPIKGPTRLATILAAWNDEPSRFISAVATVG